MTAGNGYSSADYKSDKEKQSHDIKAVIGVSTSISLSLSLSLDVSAARCGRWGVE